jgi:hypothetical protein
MAKSATGKIGKAQIYTSSWQTKIDETKYCRIGISRSTPRGQKGFRRYPKLNPGPWFRSIPDEREWAKRYEGEILAPLDPQTTVDELMTMADGRVPVLLCWEPPEPGDDYCHRGLVAAWLARALKMTVCELGQESEGCGHSHPKLPRSLRKVG